MAGHHLSSMLSARATAAQHPTASPVGRSARPEPPKRCPYDRTGAGPRFWRSRDVGLFVLNRHHQRRHDIEGRHRDDQQQDDVNITFFSICICAKKLAWRASVQKPDHPHPVAHQLAGHLAAPSKKIVEQGAPRSPGLPSGTAFGRPADGARLESYSYIPTSKTSHHGTA